MPRDADIPTTVLTHVEPVVPVTPVAPVAPGPPVLPVVPGPAAPRQAAPAPAPAPAPALTSQRAHQLADRNQNAARTRPEANGTIPGLPETPGAELGVPGLSSGSLHGDYSQSAYAYRGPLRLLCASDARADVFVDSFIFWMDTVEMVRVAGHPLVYYSGWVFPIYIFSYLSCLRVVVMPHSPLLSALGVAVQDLPFFFVRVGLIAFFGFVTPILYLMKNLLVCLAFVYFNFMTKLRIFNTERMYF